MSLIEAQSLIYDKSFFQKLFEQNIFNGVSNSLIAPNLNDLLILSNENLLDKSNQNDKIITHPNIQFLLFINQINNYFLNNTTFDLYMYYNGKIFFIKIF